MMWSAPATDSMLATSLADMGARLYREHNINENTYILSFSMKLDVSLNNCAIYECLTQWPYSVFFILPSIWVTGYDCSDRVGRGDLACVDHDQKLHQIIIDLA